MVDPRFYDLISHLWRGGSFGYYWTPDTDEGKLSFWMPASKPRQVSALWKRINVYFGIHPSRMEKGQRERVKIEDVEVVNCLFAEFDLADGQDANHLLNSIRSLDTPPSVIIFSGGGYHCYWLLAQTYHIDSDDARQRIIEIQYAWDGLVTGDNHVKDLARVLRVPGTYNRKPEYAPNYPQVEIVQFDLDQLYELDELTTQVESIINATRAKKSTSSANVMPVDLDDHIIVERMRQSDAAVDALWNGDLTAYGGDHSDADLALCNHLAYWFGRDRDRMDKAFRCSDLYRPKWLRDDYRNKTIDKAIAGCTNTYQGANSNLGNVQAMANGAHINGASTPPPTGGPAASGPATPPASIDQMMLMLSADDSGNANSVYLLHGTAFVYCKTHGYLHYNGKYWTPSGAEAALVRAVEATLIRRRAAAVFAGKHEDIVKATKPNASTVQNCIYLFKSMIDTEIDGFDSNPELLNCRNGVINLRTGVLEPHQASQKFTYCLPVDYDPQADYAAWVKFLEGAVSNPDVVAYMKLAAGYTATGYTSEECLFYIHGPSRSGKGTYAETLLMLLCKPLGVQADFSTFTAKREGDTQNFDLAPLKPARLVIASESDKYDTLNEAKVKTITGGDWIRCAFKHRDHFEYRPQFKIWLISNHPIKGDVDDDAFWGRVKIINFPHSHLGTEDKTLKHRMKSEANLRGVLRWIVEGAMEWFKDPQGLRTPPKVDDDNRQRRYELDYVQQWLDACCVVNPLEWTPNAAVYYSYKSWCEGIGMKPKGLEALSQILSKKGFRVGIRKRLQNGSQTRGVEGLKIS